MNVVYLDFNKDFDAVSHKIPIGTGELTQRDGGVSNTGYIPEPSEHDPGQPAVGDPACMHAQGGWTAWSAEAFSTLIIVRFCATD